MSGERDCWASPTTVPWKVPGGAYTSPASLFFTRQPVLAAFSRSVASASCQRKQRARFVKPKVKFRSNEGTVLLRRHLRHHPATAAGSKDATQLECETPTAEPRQKKACVKLRWFLSDTFKSGMWLHHYTDFNEENATCLITNVAALILKCGCNIWFRMQWQI